MLNCIGEMQGPGMRQVTHLISVRGSIQEVDSTHTRVVPSTNKCRDDIHGHFRLSAWTTIVG